MLIVVAGHGQYIETVINVGGTPCELLWNPASNKVYCADDDDGRVVIIDGRTNAIRAAVNVSAGPGALAWNSRRNKVYCACEDGNRIAVIDGIGDSLLTRVTTAHRPETMVYDSLDDRLYVWCWDGEAVDVIDGLTDTRVGRLDLAGYYGTCEAWHPTTDVIFCVVSCMNNCDSILTIDCATNTVRRVTYIGELMLSGCHNPRDGLVYFGGERVRAMSPAGESVAVVVPDAWASVLSLSLPQNKLFGISGGDLITIDCGAETVLTHVTIGGYPRYLVCDTVNSKVYVVDWSTSGRVVVFDATSDTIITELALEPYPMAVAWNQHDSRVYVCGYGTVYVIRDASGVQEEPVNECAGSLAVRVAPNPARGSVRFSLACGTGMPFHAAVYDVSGREIWNSSSPARQVEKNMEIDWDCRSRTGTPVPAGVYTVVVAVSRSHGTERLAGTFSILR